MNERRNERPRRGAVRKAGSLGGSRMMECGIDYPGGRYVEHIITWRKQGAEVRACPIPSLYAQQKFLGLGAVVLSLLPEMVSVVLVTRGGSSDVGDL